MRELGSRIFCLPQYQSMYFLAVVQDFLWVVDFETVSW